MINGVKVKITISFDVNMVKTEHNKYNMKNSFIWLPLAFFNALLAKYSKKFNSSNMIDIKLIEKNKTIIFKGFIPPLLTNLFIASSKSINLNPTISIIAIKGKM